MRIDFKPLCLTKICHLIPYSFFLFNNLHTVYARVQKKKKVLSRCIRFRTVLEFSGLGYGQTCLVDWTYHSGPHLNGFLCSVVEGPRSNHSAWKRKVDQLQPAMSDESTCACGEVSETFRTQGRISFLDGFEKKILF